MKKLINDPADVVTEALQGFEVAHAGTVKVDHANKVIYRADKRDCQRCDGFFGSESPHPENTMVMAPSE